MDLEIRDYFDFKRLNVILEGFNKATGFVTAILDLEGNVLSKSGWRQICTDFHRVNKDTAKKCKTSDTVLATKMADGKKYHTYKCLNGMVDVVVPIIIKEEHIANLFSGQLFFEEPRIDFFRNQARKYGFDELLYLSAVRKVPVVTEDKVAATMSVLVSIIEMISDLTIEKIEQKELNSLLETSYEEITAQYTELEETKEILEISRSRYILAFEGANSGIFDQNLEEEKYYINASWYNQFLAEPLSDSDDLSALIELMPPSKKETYERIKEEIFLSNQRTYGIEFSTALNSFTDQHWFLENGVIIRDDKEKAIRVIGSHREITHLKQNIKKIEDLKVYDQLTKLYNRSALELYLKRILSNKENNPVAIILVDLDNFQYINDQYGHNKGDEILKVLANRMMQNNAADYISRFGGDEFVLVLNDVEIMDKLIEKLHEIRYLIEKKIVIHLQTYQMSASFGVALSPDHGSDYYELLRKADLAMYQVKRTNDNTWYKIYDEMISENFEKKIKMINQIQVGIRNSELYMVFQPIINCNTGEIYSVEALMRWHHNGEFIPPDEFIRLAEKSGFIYELGLISIVESVKCLKEFKGKFNVSINFSAIQLKDPDLMEVLEKTIEAYDVPYEKIIIEITETAVIENFGQTVRILERMKELGLRIAFDDFGTGYSSLSYLTKLPVDILKIDKSFVQQINDKEETMDLIEAIVAIAKSRKLDIVFEGVETKEQLDFLINSGCPYAQGYYFYKPLSKKQLEEASNSLVEIPV